MPYINYVSEAPITLPRLSIQRDAETPRPKICYGDLHRAAAPAPRVFTPNADTLADRARREVWRKRYLAKKATLAPLKPKQGYDWRPQIVARMIELISDYGLCRRVVAEKLNAEFPQPHPVNKSAVVMKFLRETKDPNYGRTQHNRDA